MRSYGHNPDNLGRKQTEAASGRETAAEQVPAVGSGKATSNLVGNDTGIDTGKVARQSYHKNLKAA